MKEGDIVTVTGMIRPPEGAKVRIWNTDFYEGTGLTCLCYDLDATIPEDPSEARRKAYWLKPANIKVIQ